jgi:hypothetical protein
MVGSDMTPSLPLKQSLSGAVYSVLTQNQLLAPSTQQAEQSWLQTQAGSEACQSIFLKLTKDENS